MSVLVQNFTPMTSAQYDATSALLKPVLEGFEGYLGFHAAAVVDGGMQITELWTTSDAHKTWISDVVATKAPAEAIAAMKVTYTPLHDVVLAGSPVTA
ncbi:MAG: hypothetical protein JWM98_74 [Thermoleophilia bacterium]|nr:hypothetical protein [Thermoleophilia bacterium]